MDRELQRLVADGTVEEIEEFLLQRAGRLRGFLRLRFGALLGDEQSREEVVLAAVRRAARNADLAPPAGSPGGVELWLWRVGVDEATGIARRHASTEEEARELPALVSEEDAQREFAASPSEPAPERALPFDDRSTEELVEALKRGDERAWSQLARNVRSILMLGEHKHVPKGVRARFDTEDLCQSVMFSAFLDIASFE